MAIGDENECPHKPKDDTNGVAITLDDLDSPATKKNGKTGTAVTSSIV